MMQAMRIALFGLAALLAAGCGRGEEVRRYKAPKDPTWTILAAIVPGGAQTWFFKVAAPTDRARAHKDEVVKLVQSVKAEEGKLRWTLPAGWEEKPGSGERLSTLLIGAEQPRLELTVTHLPGAAGGALANVNRWRGQLGLAPIAEAELAGQTQKVQAGPVEVLVVDLTGPQRPSGGPAMRSAEPAHEQPPSLGAVRKLFSYDKPAGWKENPEPAEQRRILEFQAGEGAGVTLSAFPGDVGGLAPNVNRWRQQAGLAPLEEPAAIALVKAVTFLGKAGSSVELVGPERAVLCFFNLNEEFSIFLKMDGTASAVAAEKAAFEAFAASLKLNH